MVIDFYSTSSFKRKLLHGICYKISKGTNLHIVMNYEKGVFIIHTVQKLSMRIIANSKVTNHIFAPYLVTVGDCETIKHSPESTIRTVQISFCTI